MRSAESSTSADHRGRSKKLLLIVLWIVAIGSLGFDAVRRFRLDTSMTEFLPSGDAALLEVSRRVVDSSLTQRMILTLTPNGDGTSRAQLAESARLLAERLKAVEGISGVERAPPIGVEQAYYELYFPRRFTFFSMNPADDLKARFDANGLSASAEDLRETLGGPEGLLVRRLAEKDPWLLFRDVLDQADAARPAKLTVEAGQFFAQDGSAVLFVDLRDSAIDVEAQKGVLRAIDDAILRVREATGTNFRVEQSGVNRFAVSSERSVRGDAERVATLSTIGVVLLFLFLFRSPLKLVFAFVPLLSGVVVALWASLFVYGSLHAMTLAFGSALIGVAIDYPVHLVSHHDLAPPGRDPRQSLHRIRGALALAAGTTVIGLAGLAWTSFPGIREIALFTAVGVMTAAGVTAFGAPLLGSSGNASHAERRLAGWLDRRLRWVEDRRIVLAGVLGAVTLGLLTGLSTTRWQTSLQALSPANPALLAEDERVRQRVGALEGGRFVVTFGEDLEQALRRNEAVARALARLKNEGVVEGFTTAAAFLRSESTQREVHRVLEGTTGLAERTRDALANAGFRPEAFGAIDGELQHPAPPLTFQDVVDSPLGALVRPLVLTMPSGRAVVTPVRGVQDAERIAEAMSAIDETTYFSQRDVLDTAYVDLRRRVVEMMLLGLLLVLVVTWARYRRWQPTLAAVVPALLAGSSTLGLLSWFGQPLNLIHVLALLLVLSIGVDYGVFLVESEARSNAHDEASPNQESERSSALLSIVLGCVTTLLSFGVLALSDVPALRALGTVIGIGVTLSVVLAPIALLLAAPRQRDIAGSSH